MRNAFSLKSWLGLSLVVASTVGCGNRGGAQGSSLNSPLHPVRVASARFTCLNAGNPENGIQNYVVGNVDSLGNWAIPPSQGLLLTFNPENHSASGIIYNLPFNTRVEWKCVQVDSD